MLRMLLLAAMGFVGYRAAKENQDLIEAGIDAIQPPRKPRASKTNAGRAPKRVAHRDARTTH